MHLTWIDYSIIGVYFLFVIGIGVSAYILLNQDSRPTFPWEAKPYVLKGEFSTAQAVTPGQGQSIRVAGVQVGAPVSPGNAFSIRRHPPTKGDARASVDPGSALGPARGRRRLRRQQPALARARRGARRRDLRARVR